MIYFDTDYMAGAHPKVMERLVQTNAEQTVGYGSDHYTLRAKELVIQACSAPDARVYFLVGGEGGKCQLRDVGTARRNRKRRAFRDRLDNH